MNTQLTPFAFGDNMVRVRRDANGDLWFVAKDVCQVLEIQNPSDTVHKGLDEDEKADIDIIYTSSSGVAQRRSVLAVSESGLYALVFRSRKPEAKAFSKWVRAEVLPALRKTGQYRVSGTISTAQPAMPEELPGDVLAVRPAMRQRLWRDALDTARLEGAGLDVALQWFLSLCRMVAAAPPAPTPAGEKVRAFFTSAASMRKAPASRPGICTRPSGVGTATKRAICLPGNGSACISRNLYGVAVPTAPGMRVCA